MLPIYKSEKEYFMLTSNHFVHYTTSNILILLPHTQFSLHSVENLLLNYQLAPLSGEIGFGGACGLANSMTTAFARVGDTCWSQDRLLNGYGHIKIQQQFPDKNSFKTALTQECKFQFTNIMEILAKSLRDYHLGTLPSLSDSEIEELKKSFIENRDRITRIFIFQVIAAKFLLKNKGKTFSTSDPDFLDQQKKREEQTAQLNERYNQIPLDFLDKTSQEQFKIATDLFSQFSNIFVLALDKIKEQPKQNDVCDYMYSLNTTLLDPTRQDFLGTVWEPSRANKLSPTDIHEIVQTCEHVIKKFVEKINLILNILDGKVAKPLSSGDQKKALSPFPIAFFLEGDDALTPNHDEFRATKALVLGQDIKTIGVAKENLSALLEFLSTYNLQTKVTVIDINSTIQSTRILYSSPQEQQSTEKTISEMIQHIRKGEDRIIVEMINHNQIKNVNEPTSSCQTLLHIASCKDSHDHANLVERLLQAKADFTIPDGASMTPVDYAIHSDNEPILHIYSHHLQFTQQHLQFARTHNKTAAEKLISSCLLNLN